MASTPGPWPEPTGDLKAAQTPSLFWIVPVRTHHFKTRYATAQASCLFLNVTVRTHHFNTSYATAQSLWAGRNRYRATCAVHSTSVFRSHRKNRLIQSLLTKHKRIWRTYSNPDPQESNIIECNVLIDRIQRFLKFKFSARIIIYYQMKDPFISKINYGIFDNRETENFSARFTAFELKKSSTTKYRLVLMKPFPISIHTLCWTWIVLRNRCEMNLYQWDQCLHCHTSHNSMHNGEKLTSLHP
jgi:hypothetical protein